MSTKRLSLLALFIALSVIGASIKIPAVVGSIALDFFPALIAAVFLGRSTGAMVAGFGHFLSALIVGMPLGPMHIIIALEMAAIVWIFQMIYENRKPKLAGLFAVVSNTLIAPIPMLFLLGIGFYVALLPSLFIGATVNTVAALLLIPRFEGIFDRVLASDMK